MVLKVETIFKETIKPSSPTPKHLKAFKFSIIDQCAPSNLVPIILFYSADDKDKVHNENRPDALRKSLSEILTYFYPLAGRINGNHFIDCNDEGVNFIQARVNCQLSQVLKQPIPEELDQLLPRPGNFYGLCSEVLLSIQVNIFDCGGIALTVFISHKAADASSLSLFLKSWAALAREDDEIPRPQYDLTSLFPPKLDIPSYTFTTKIPLQKVVPKRFVLDASNIVALIAKCSHNSHVKQPTPVEAVIALIWRCAMNAARMRVDFMKSASMMAVAINLRKRMIPPLSELNFGNPGTMATLASSTIDSCKEVHCLVGQLRDAIQTFDEDVVKTLQVNDGFLGVHDSFMKVYEQSTKGELELYLFTSWCNFSFYDTDFGWGKPVWACFSNFPRKNRIVLMDTKSGKGIEASVALTEEDMAIFECDPEILSYTSINHVA